MERDGVMWPLVNAHMGQMRGALVPFIIFLNDIRAVYIKLYSIFHLMNVGLIFLIAGTCGAL